MLALQQQQMQRPHAPAPAALPGGGARRGLLLPASQAPPPRRRSGRRPDVAVFAAEESFGDAVKRVAKRVQGALPIIGLLSRLTSPEGGFDGANSTTYAEFSRAVYNSVADDAPGGAGAAGGGGDPANSGYAAFSVAADELEKAHGRPASARYLLFALWMADQGAGGLVQPRDVVAAMRRLRVTGDMEIEIDRFTAARDASLAKYAMVERPAAPAEARAELGVDAVAAVALGLKEGAPIAGEDARRVAGAVAAGLRVPLAAAEAAVAGRAERSLAQQQQAQQAGQKVNK